MYHNVQQKTEIMLNAKWKYNVKININDTGISFCTNSTKIYEYT